MDHVSVFYILFLEIACFAGLAFIVWNNCSGRWVRHSEESVSNRIDGMIRFIYEASDRQDQMLRILAANYETTLCITGDGSRWQQRSTALNQYIDKTYDEQGLKGLKLFLYK